MARLASLLCLVVSACALPMPLAEDTDADDGGLPNPPLTGTAAVRAVTPDGLVVLDDLSAWLLSTTAAADELSDVTSWRVGDVVTVSGRALGIQHAGLPHDFTFVGQAHELQITAIPDALDVRLSDGDNRILAGGVPAGWRVGDAVLLVSVSNDLARTEWIIHESSNTTRRSVGW
jgi:hypothetical protein